MRTEVADVYKIKYKTFCHCINGRTAAKGHASGGTRRRRVFTVGKYIIDSSLHNNKNLVLAGWPHLINETFN